MTADEASELFLKEMDAAIQAGPPRVPLDREAAAEMLSWITAANYHAAMLLTRLRTCGLPIEREDGKDVDGWVVEQVRMGNLARAARLRLEGEGE